MHDFVSHILRRYFEATHWNEYNSYLHLTSSSSAILDFGVPTGLSLSISASPTPPFFTTYRLGALPNLRAGIGYIYASTRRPVDFGGSSKDVALKQVIERFRIVEATRRREREREREYYWLGGERYEHVVEEKERERGGGEYLVYGCMHVPSARLDALWTRRMSPTWQLIVTAVSTPPKYPLSALHTAALATQYAARAPKSGTASLDSSTHNFTSTPPQPSTTSTPLAPTATAQDVYALGAPGSTNLQLTLQRDTGRWFTEYSYSVDDALWGLRVLHNFGAADGATASGTDAVDTSTVPARSGSGASSAEDPDAGGGLRGRFSAGAEVFVSTVEKSAGLSTGIRFSTLPDPQPIITPSPADALPTPSQPPTVITATLNPMMGHLSTAYAARMARDVVVCSRFDFNVYSYESEWTVGAEYWLRRSAAAVTTDAPSTPAASRLDVDTRAKTLSLRDEPRDALSDDAYSLRPAPPTIPAPPASTTTSPITGVLKARISTTSDIRLLWQGRLSSCLVSLGVKADLAPTHRASAKGIVQSIGVEVMYFSQP
ncbi:related to MDM10-mitochondrial morphology and inheritance component [Sporisorium reilianum f. sp. reilianum]|uniref:Mitochondrial distribution and morphology protein 10 n=1 Tax=Sporisorium reilianum f. sp. reilianum TaxID=72559 RepID=A0A2N8U9T2_9BASI|nr:related to MDM10-mitochondrial morphology and inheritance component [Sporisorium reilianum f. sp. reilianum]